MMIASTPAVVLIVEDEPLVRMLGVDVLEEAGFVVIEAADGREALLILAAHPEVSVVFTDINMPGHPDGLELAAKVLADRPGVGVLIASGKVRPDAGELPNGSRFLPKPWASEEVVDTVHSLLRAA